MPGWVPFDADDWLEHLSWLPHDLIGHPLSRLLYLALLPQLAEWVHDGTMPPDRP
jgi:hypothetical protein